MQRCDWLAPQIYTDQDTGHVQHTQDTAEPNSCTASTRALLCDAPERARQTAGCSCEKRVSCTEYIMERTQIPYRVQCRKQVRPRTRAPYLHSSKLRASSHKDRPLSVLCAKDAHRRDSSSYSVPLPVHPKPYGCNSDQVLVQMRDRIGIRNYKRE